MGVLSGSQTHAGPVSRRCIAAIVCGRSDRGRTGNSLSRRPPTVRVVLPESNNRREGIRSFVALFEISDEEP